MKNNGGKGMGKEDVIRVMTLVPGGGVKAFQSAGGLKEKVIELEKKILMENLQRHIQIFQDILDGQAEGKRYFVDEFVFELGINAEGGFELFGKVTAGAKAGIAVKIKRKPSPASASK